MDYVYSVETKNKTKLKTVLDADPYAEKSFARLGYDLKSSDSVNLPLGKYFLHFKSEESVDDLVAKIKEVESVEEASDEEKVAVLKSLEAGLDNAVAGFGNIFG